MANDLTTSNNALINSIGKEIASDSNFEKLCNMDVAKQKEKLKGLFTQVSDNNVSAKEKAALEKSAENLLNKIEALKAKIKQLRVQINEKNSQIEKKAEEIATLATNAQQASNTMENKHKEVVKLVVQAVLSEYKNGNIKQDEVSDTITARIKSNSTLSSDKTKVEAIIHNLNSKQGQVKNLTNSATALLNNKSILERQYNVSQCEYDFLNTTLNQIGSVSTTYNNSDYDSNAPIYSLDKLDFASSLYEKYNPSEPSNTNSKDDNIQTNNQLKTFSENYSGILDSLKENKFSFKEAMYLLFNKDNGLFKDCGITYDLSEQYEGMATYNIASSSDPNTAEMYNKFAYKVKGLWDVNAVNPNSKAQSKAMANTKQTDNAENNNPVTFRKGDIEYAFVLDRNNDSKFGGANELMGNGDTGNWLEEISSFDYNKDGIIDESDVDKNGVSALSQIKLLGTKFEEGNTISYSTSSADSLGISNIDLRQYFDKATGKYDFSKINNDSNNKNGILNNCFSITMKDGSKIESKMRSDDAYSSQLDTIYNSASEKNFTIGLSDQEADELINESYKKSSESFKELMGDTSNLSRNVSLINNYDQVKKETNKVYKNATRQAERYETASLSQAQNKVNSQKIILNKWSDEIENEVLNYAMSMDIKDIDMSKAQAIFNTNSFSGDAKDVAKQVVEEFKTQKDEQEEKTKKEEEDKEQEKSDIAFEALIKCFKNGLNVTSGEINKLLEEGKAHDVNEVVEYVKENLIEQEKTEKPE